MMLHSKYIFENINVEDEDTHLCRLKFKYYVQL